MKEHVIVIFADDDEGMQKGWPIRYDVCNKWKL